LRLPLSTVYHLAKSGTLPAFQLGRSWRFPAREIERLADSGHARLKVLVVDEDGASRTLAADALQPRNCLVTEAASLTEAVTAMRRQRFDLLLLDFQTSGTSTLDVVRELHANCTASRVVIVAAHPDLAAVHDLFDVGALTLLRKPLAPAQLVECVEHVLGARLPGARGDAATKEADYGTDPFADADYPPSFEPICADHEENEA
jgi:excisionase family DNA binding protein